MHLAGGGKTGRSVIKFSVAPRESNVWINLVSEDPQDTVMWFCINKSIKEESYTCVLFLGEYALVKLNAH